MSEKFEDSQEFISYQKKKVKTIFLRLVNLLMRTNKDYYKRFLHRQKTRGLLNLSGKVSEKEISGESIAIFSWGDWSAADKENN